MNNPTPKRYAAPWMRESLLGCAFIVLPLIASAGTNAVPVNGDARAPSSNAAPASRPAQPSEMPSAEELTRLLRNTLDRVDHSNKTGSYLGVYGMLTPQVQQKVDLQKLADAMSGFRKLNVDMAPVQKTAPQFAQPPQLSEEGLLTLRGGFPIQPRPVRFDLSYVRVDGDWRLQVLNLDAPPVQPVAAARTTPAVQSPAQAAGDHAAGDAPAATVAQAPASPPAAPATTQGGTKAAASVSPFLDTSTDPPTASKW